MTYLVIGGTGFVGAYVVKEILDHGEEVVALDWMPDPTAMGHLGLDKKVKVVKGDVLDYQGLLNAIKENHVTKIATLASGGIPPGAPKEVRKENGGAYLGIRTNIEGVRNVLEAARTLDVERVVKSSSAGVYGNLPPLGRPLTEDDPTAPANVGYMAAKVGEMVTEEYNELYDLDCLVVRFGGQVYGPRLFRARSGVKQEGSERLFDAIVDLFENGSLGKRCRVTEPDFVKSWVYVKDAARAMYAGLEAKGVKHRLFNAPGFVHSNREVAEMVKKYVKDSTIDYVQSEVNRFDKRVQAGWKHAYEYSRVKAELGWEPKYDIDLGVHEFVNYQRSLSGLPAV
ncbi:MAG: NAD(P)-dependent oxidoreductase [Nitrososphaerota archaeon]|nr:NAD(P)-dependent oxidoreductase [Nitrososphaerota archaeon]MDG6922238.1 NAD(P)-dependent oxidoreductase [Nitrososphaerota archaeon]